MTNSSPNSPTKAGSGRIHPTTYIPGPPPNVPPSSTTRWGPDPTYNPTYDLPFPQTRIQAAYQKWYNLYKSTLTGHNENQLQKMALD